MAWAAERENRRDFLSLAGRGVLAFAGAAMLPDPPSTLAGLPAAGSASEKEPRTLQILPIGYSNVPRIREMGEGIVYAFAGLVGGYRLLDALSIRTLEPVVYEDRTLAEAGATNPLLFVNGEKLIDLIHERYGGLTLAVMDMPAMNMDRTMYYDGQGSDSKDAGYVTTRWSQVRHDGALAKLGAHEVGHMLGLPHHNGKKSAAGDRLCLMTISHLQDALKGTITAEQYYDMQADFFCRGCYERLYRPFLPSSTALGYLSE